MLAEPAVQLESDPPERETSDGVKSEESSERENVMVAVWLVLREEASAEIRMVGDVLSSRLIRSDKLNISPLKLTCSTLFNVSTPSG